MKSRLKPLGFGKTCPNVIHGGLKKKKKPLFFSGSSNVKPEKSAFVLHKPVTAVRFQSGTENIQINTTSACVAINPNSPPKASPQKKNWSAGTASDTNNRYKLLPHPRPIKLSCPPHLLCFPLPLLPDSINPLTQPKRSFFFFLNQPKLNITPPHTAAATAIRSFHAQTRRHTHINTASSHTHTHTVCLTPYPAEVPQRLRPSKNALR